MRALGKLRSWFTRWLVADVPDGLYACVSCRKEACTVENYASCENRLRTERSLRRKSRLHVVQQGTGSGTGPCPTVSTPDEPSAVSGIRSQSDTQSSLIDRAKRALRR